MVRGRLDWAAPAPSAKAVEDRWIVSRLQVAIEAVSGNLASYDFAHAALELYRFFWSEFCDWGLEMEKERLRSKDATVAEDARNVLAWVPLARGFSIDGERTNVLNRDWKYLFRNAPPKNAPAPLYKRQKYGVTTGRSDPVH